MSNDTFNKENLMKLRKKFPDTNIEFELVKPFFCPLYKEFFLKFESGEQDCEIRPLDHRGWNHKNIYVGRDILFSNGYGKYNRVKKYIRSTMSTHDLAQEKIPQWHIDAVEKIYGKRDRWLVAYV